MLLFMKLNLRDTAELCDKKRGPRPKEEADELALVVRKLIGELNLPQT